MKGPWVILIKQYMPYVTSLHQLRDDPQIPTFRGAVSAPL